MCGIVGYIGNREAQPILVNALKRLEYRGYDSCGTAVSASAIQLHKDIGRIAQLEETMPLTSARKGVGHTRWATHGKPSKLNAHPHLDCTGEIAVVHNGVIDNYQSLREQLIKEGHIFHSETDTEVVSHLIEKHLRDNFKEAVRRALLEIEGSYAIIALHAYRHELIVARKESPLILGLGDNETFIASDAPAILDYTDRVVYLEDGDIALITTGNIQITNGDEEVKRDEHKITWNIEDAQKGGYDHFMIKEIHEQPRVIANTLRGHISAIDNQVDLGITIDKELNDIFMVACGTSYYASLVGKWLIENLAEIPVRVEMASEFNYSKPIVDKTWSIGITQSGETADTLMALKKASALGCSTLAITNVVGSTATRITDQTFFIKAGPEISVAATKSFIGQLVALYMLAISLANGNAKYREILVSELRQLPGKVEQLLENKQPIMDCSKYIAKQQNMFFIARGINYPIALEGALKMKEISYINAEGYAAGELKHGPFALLTPGVPVLAIVAKDETYNTMLAN
ncbi:glutamine--fructose-6-phosphate transaminase (isomerizing), partial [Chloroflexota bacterium]